ncbi:MAG: EF-hand domain-containing protein [Gammaproteobacteria bacterium]
MTEPNAEKRSDLRATFDKYDKNGNGSIDWDEFCLLLDELVGDMALDEKSLAFHLVDTNHTGYINFEEFVKWWDNR